jgi:hypothetical protein
MLRLTLPEVDKRIVAKERYVHLHPRVRQRMWALWLKNEGVAHQDIARTLGA